MCDRLVNAFARTLKLVPDWFLTNKILEDFDNLIFLNDDIVFVNAGSDNVAFLVIIWVL